MDSQQTDEILDLMSIMVSSYPSQAGQDSTAAIRGYMMAIDGCSYRAIRQVLENVIKGKQAGFARKFAPSSGDLGEWCRTADAMFAQMETTPKIREHGILKLNFGGRDIYTADMPLAEVEELIRTNGKSFGRQDAIGSVIDGVVRRISVGDPDGNVDAGEAA